MIQIIMKLLPGLIEIVKAFFRKRAGLISKQNTNSNTKNESIAPVIKNKDNPIAQRVSELAEEFSYENDELKQATVFAKGLYDKTACVIHYSYTPTLQALDYCFTNKKAHANSTWGVGKDGTTHRYLHDVRVSSWTQGITATEDGGFIDHKGKWVKNINYLATSFEVVNMPSEDYTPEQYEAVAVRVMWQLLNFDNFRLWFVTGHEHITPITRNDPGPKWDWKLFFCTYLGVREDFYNEYLAYLADNSYYTINDKTLSVRKLQSIRGAVDKIVSDLIDKPKEFCF